MFLQTVYRNLFFLVNVFCGDCKSVFKIKDETVGEREKKNFWGDVMYLKKLNIQEFRKSLCMRTD